MEKKSTIYLKLLKIILGTYIILAILIAGLNYGYARAAPQNIASIKVSGAASANKGNSLASEAQRSVDISSNNN
jgi:cell division septal protein FtsQ